MTKLTCDAANCASNKDNLCCQGAIKVQGQEATRPCDTRCQSFTEKGHELSNSTHYCQCNTQAEVKCTAKNCIHNNDGTCVAEGIHIGTPSAHTMSETECATFAER